MSTVVVAGGTGNLGSAVVAALAESGHRPRIVSRRPRPAGAPIEHEWEVVDYRTGAGMVDAFAGADAVVLATGALRDAPIVRTVLDAAPPALHVVYTSIVGIDRVSMPYYRAKLTGERALQASTQPWTILRATQFHDLALSMARALTRLPVAPVPRGMRLQPVSAAEVGARLAELAVDAPAGHADEFGGPEVLSVDDVVRICLGAIGRRARIASVPAPGRMMRAIADGGLLTENHAVGTQTFAEFVAEWA